MDKIFASDNLNEQLRYADLKVQILAAEKFVPIATLERLALTFGLQTLVNAIIDTRHPDNSVNEVELETYLSRKGGSLE